MYAFTLGHFAKTGILLIMARHQHPMAPKNLWAALLLWSLLSYVKYEFSLNEIALLQTYSFAKYLENWLSEQI